MINTTPTTTNYKTTAKEQYNKNYGFDEFKSFEPSKSFESVESEENIQKEIQIKEYAQHVELHVEDVMKVLTALLNAGYECRIWSDGESTDYVAIDFINPEFTGHSFVESEY